MKKWHFLLAFGVLLIPVLWLGFLKQGEIISKKLPVYGERTYQEETGDTLFHRVSDFAFIDQLGDTVTQEDFKGKIYIANFFFASCPDICPSMMQNVQFVYSKYKDAPDVRFLSHTVDPKRDSVEVLKKYAYNIGARPKQWYFVSGSKADLYYAAEYDYLLAAVETSLEDAFIHSEHLALIDKEKRIRGYYNGLDFNDMRRLSDDIKILIVEDNERNGKK
jgi:protein SCO1/2